MTAWTAEQRLKHNANITRKKNEGKQEKLTAKYSFSRKVLTPYSTIIHRGGGEYLWIFAAPRRGELNICDSSPTLR